MRRNLALAFLLVAVHLLSGCGMVAVSLVNETASSLTGKQCEVQNAFKEKPFCDDFVPPPSPVVHCFRTLASVNCYNEPNPFAAGQFTNQPMLPPAKVSTDVVREDKPGTVIPASTWPGIPKPI
ncbi:MAG: hypothetical protein FJX61_12925 [Alphaproteobacteria bacterium]|nr:hypothetical protein [Alphaproteobacteria bacterium]